MYIKNWADRHRHIGLNHIFRTIHTVAIQSLKLELTGYTVDTWFLHQIVWTIIEANNQQRFKQKKFCFDSKEWKQSLFVLIEYGTKKSTSHCFPSEKATFISLKETFNENILSEVNRFKDRDFVMYVEMNLFGIQMKIANICITMMACLCCSIFVSWWYVCTVY